MPWEYAEGVGADLPAEELGLAKIRPHPSNASGTGVGLFFLELRPERLDDDDAHGLAGLE